MNVYHIGQGLAGVAALLGVALIGVGMAMSKKRRGDKETGRQGEGQTT